MMNKKFISHDASHKSMPMDSSMLMNAEDQDKNTVSKKQFVKIFEAAFIKESLAIPNSRRQNSRDFNSHRNLSFLNVKPAERCDQTNFVASGSYSNAGKRGQQTFDNCLLLSFADKPRPPTNASVNFKIRIICGFKELTQSSPGFSRGPPIFFS